MIVKNLTSSNIPLGPYILKPGRSRTLPEEACRELATKVLIEQLKKHRKIETFDDKSAAQAAPSAPFKANSSMVGRSNRKARSAALPEAPEEITRESLSVASMDEIEVCAMISGIDLIELEDMSEDEARLYVGSIVFNDPDLVK